MEVIEEGLRKRFPNCKAIGLMARPTRNSTQNDYQQKWMAFINYLYREKVSPGSLKDIHLINFLKELFDNGKKPGTVNKYKTALTKPLSFLANINVKIDPITDLIRAMYIEKPNMPSEDPQWNLNKVLKYIDEEMPTHPSEGDLLAKAAFLLLLASGMRISELHACMRTKDCCNFTRDNFLELSHHPNFLAKNERPDKRWKFKVIKPLRTRSGRASKLCPVESLKAYLKKSPRIKTGRLFRSTHKDRKPLTKFQLSQEVCKLIIRADPNTRARVHDVRKYAASCSLATTMITPAELSRAIGWSNTISFYRFYRTAIEPLNREVSLPGPDPRDRYQ